MALKILGNTVPIWIVAFSGAHNSVASLTKGSVQPLTLSAKEISKIVWYSLDLLLKNIGNQDKLLGISVNDVLARKSKNKVRWSDMVRRNL